MKPEINIRVVAEGTLARPVFEGPTLITSDHHLNVHDGRDNFQAELFVSFLMGYHPRGWSLLFLADLFDIWEAGSLPPILRDNAAVLALISFYRRKRLVAGNHDEALCQADLPDRLGIELSDVIDETGAFAWHGHQLDPACSGAGARFGKLATVFWAALEVLRLGPMLEGVKDSILRGRRRKSVTASKRGDDNDRYIQDALERVDLAMDSGAEAPVLIFSGHTHEPQLLRIPGLPGHYYANPGTWTRPGRGGAIEIVGTRIRLIEVTSGV